MANYIIYYKTIRESACGLRLARPQVESAAVLSEQGLSWRAIADNCIGVDASGAIALGNGDFILGRFIRGWGISAINSLSPSCLAMRAPDHFSITTCIIQRMAPADNSAPTIPNLQFLKLGGSLITDKTRPRAVRPQALARLAGEIAAALRQDPTLRLLLGHGAGSFGHVPALRYGTRQGARTPQEWLGFAEVWREAAALNRLVVDALVEAGLPVISLPPSASVYAQDGQVASWNIAPIQAALQASLLPVIQGDTIFDAARGGTILSTEDLFARLAQDLRPRRVLLAGLEPGVWADYPKCEQLLAEITPRNLAGALPSIGGSAAADVTGGMLSKVRQSLELAQRIPSLQVFIFSGEIEGAVEQALLGQPQGTAIHI
ncbi:MAG: isopentenyl phosphate kinase family protein [Anaerolineales bacterium]|nr:isopentenyl phosphate kinase family protein [Anaerolineales bacterium]